MCNLYSVTTNQAAIAALFRVMNRYVGNLPAMGRPSTAIGARSRSLWGAAQCLRLPNYLAEPRGRADPPQGDAGDPDDRRRARRLDAGAMGRGQRAAAALAGRCAQDRNAWR